MTAVQAGDLRRRVHEVRWWHTIDLGDGVVTPGSDPSPRRLRGLELPARLDGMSVLDVGAYDGFYSFEAERRGAERVVALDTAMWHAGPPYTGKAGFELAREALGSRVEDREVEVVDISPETVGTFDLVLFLGVLYHMPHPWLALQAVASVTERHLIVETASDLPWSRRPAAAVYAGAELGGDASNWWGFNAAAVLAMVRSLGFARAEVVSRPSPARRMARVAARAGRALRSDRKSIPAAAQQGRVVVHAFR